MTNTLELVEERLAKVKELRSLEAELLRFSLLSSLLEFSNQNGGRDIDWSNREQIKYCINYNYKENQIEVFEINDYRDLGQVYFATRKACENAIKEFKEDILKYYLG